MEQLAAHSGPTGIDTVAICLSGKVITCDVNTKNTKTFKTSSVLDCARFLSHEPVSPSVMA